MNVASSNPASPARHVRGAVVAAVLGTVVLSVLGTPLANAQPRNRTDPLDASAPVPRTIYRSSFASYRMLTEEKPSAAGNWQAANERVGRIGGWRVYAREAEGATAPTTPSGAIAPTAPVPATAPAAPRPHQHNHGGTSR